MTYIPQVDDYVRWNRPGMPDHVDEDGYILSVMKLLASKLVLRTNHTANIQRTRNTRRFTS